MAVNIEVELADELFSIVEELCETNDLELGDALEALIRAGKQFMDGEKAEPKGAFKLDSETKGLVRDIAKSDGLKQNEAAIKMIKTAHSRLMSLRKYANKAAGAKKPAKKPARKSTKAAAPKKAARKPVKKSTRKRSSKKAA